MTTAARAKSLRDHIRQLAFERDIRLRCELGDAPYDPGPFHAIWDEYVAEMAPFRELLWELGYGDCPLCNQTLEDWHCHCCGERYDEFAQARLRALPKEDRDGMRLIPGRLFAYAKGNAGEAAGIN